MTPPGEDELLIGGDDFPDLDPPAGGDPLAEPQQPPAQSDQDQAVLEQLERMRRQIEELEAIVRAQQVSPQLPEQASDDNEKLPGWSGPKQKLVDASTLGGDLTTGPGSSDATSSAGGSETGGPHATMPEPQPPFLPDPPPAPAPEPQPATVPEAQPMPEPQPAAAPEPLQEPAPAPPFDPLSTEPQPVPGLDLPAAGLPQAPPPTGPQATEPQPAPAPPPVQTPGSEPASDPQQEPAGMPPMDPAASQSNPTDPQQEPAGVPPMDPAASQSNPTMAVYDPSIPSAQMLHEEGLPDVSDARAEFAPGRHPPAPEPGSELPPAAPYEQGPEATPQPEPPTPHSSPAFSDAGQEAAAPPTPTPDPYAAQPPPASPSEPFAQQPPATDSAPPAADPYGPAPGADPYQSLTDPYAQTNRTDDAGGSSPLEQFAPEDVLVAVGRRNQADAERVEALNEQLAYNRIRADAQEHLHRKKNNRTRKNTRRGGKAPAFPRITTQFVPGHPLTIAVTSPKGGVGKSTTAANLAAGFAKAAELSGRGDEVRVLLVDGDVANGNLALRVAQRIEPNLLDMLNHMDDMTSKGSDLTDYDRDMAPWVLAHPKISNLDVLAAPENPDILHQITQEDLEYLMTTWSRFYQVVVIDTGTQITEHTNCAWLAFADQVYLMVEPELTCLQSTAEYARRAKRLNLLTADKCRLIMIRADMELADLDPRQVASEVFSFIRQDRQFFVADFHRDAIETGNAGEFLILESAEYAADLMPILEAALESYERGG